jgi:hypothetical protein
MNTVINVMGLVGLLSIGLIPLRSWGFISGILRGGRRLVVIAAITLVVLAMAGDGIIVFRIFKCLTRSYCGPGIASGWIYLAMLGSFYLLFESSMFLVRKVGRCAEMRR